MYYLFNIMPKTSGFILMEAISCSKLLKLLLHFCMYDQFLPSSSVHNVYSMSIHWNRFGYSHNITEKLENMLCHKRS